MASILGIQIRNPITTAINKAVESRVNAQLATMGETDATIVVGTRTGADIFKDRNNYDRETIIRETLLAWRTNPIARRLIDTLVEFVVGDGMAPEYEKINNATLRKELKAFWENPLNNMDEQIPELVAEQSRSGDLFALCSVNKVNGDMFVRGLPSEEIKEIQHADNDYRQETYYLRNQLDKSPYAAYDPNDPEQTQFVLHFPINRPVGASFGESDLTPVLRWLGRLNTLINDRVIMNHLRNLISYIVTIASTDPKKRKARELEINLNPPNPGQVIVTDQSEIWGVLAPNLQAYDAAADILGIKKHIAAGFGVPLHYLAEPESSTRTTAEAAGTPTFRKFKMRQNSIRRAMALICTIAMEKKRYFSKKRIGKEQIEIRTDDVTERDNSTLALAAARIEPALADLFDRELIDEATYLLLFHEMLGNDYDTSQPAPKGKRAPLSKSDQATKPVEDSGTSPDDQTSQEQTDAG